MDMTGVIVILLVACLVLISICLGLALGVLLILRRRKIEGGELRQTASDDKTKGQPNADVSQNEETQLDRIERLVKQATLSSTRLGVLAIAVAAVIFAGTGLEIDIWLRVFLLVLGLACIFLSRYIH